MQHSRVELMLVAAACLGSAAAFAAGADESTTDSAQQSAPSAGGLEEITVTARRREESALTVPVSISALSASDLASHGIQEIQDLNTVVPGFRFGSNGGKDDNDVTLRGLSRIPLGEGIPAVVTYFANVPLPGNGSNVPTFDLADIQVLKGPQGTLFGRNTLGGAVVVTPQRPTYDLGGYVSADYGSYHYHAFEGALNLPVIDQKLAVRLSGDIRRQDGSTLNLSGGANFDNIHEDSFRASVLAQPIEGLTNLLVYDYFQSDEEPGGLYLVNVHPGILGALFSPTLGPTVGGQIGQALDAQIATYYAGQQAAGYHAVYTDIPDDGAEHRLLWGLSNDTSLDVGDLTVRNIFGYRHQYIDQVINTGATGPLFLPGATPVPFTLFHAAELFNRQYLTDELQLLGKSFDQKLNWIVGAFYDKDQPDGPAGSNFTAYSAGGVPGQFITAQVTNESRAVFGQGGLDLSDWVVSGLTFNLGLRYTWDKVFACGGSVPGGYVSEGECTNLATVPGSDFGTVSNQGNAPSWTIGFDYKYSDKTFFYLTSRRGYRAVNVNTPLFQSPYTTGVLGPDLRPYQKIGEEKLTDLEVGVKSDWRMGDLVGRVNWDFYGSKYKNALQFFNVQALVAPQASDFPTNGSIGINAADETIWGSELTLQVQPVEALTLSLVGAFTNATVDDVKPGPLGLTLTKSQITLPSPRWSGTASASWTLPWQLAAGKIAATGDYYVTEKFGGQYGISLPGYQLANMRIDWRAIAHTGLDLGVYARNLFNKSYFTSTSNLLPTFPANSVYPGMQRTWGVEVRYDF